MAHPGSGVVDEYIDLDREVASHIGPTFLAGGRFGDLLYSLMTAVPSDICLNFKEILPAKPNPKPSYAVTNIIRETVDVMADTPKPIEPRVSFAALVRSGQLQEEVAGCLSTISRIAAATSNDIYLVGGMVRDLVAQLPEISTSPDISVIGDAEDFAHTIVTDTGRCQLVAVSQHHTAKLKFDHIFIDVASARIDSYEPYGSLPEITLVDDIETDLSRRDFTINAMAMPIHPDGLGGLIDPFGGRGDTHRGILRIIREDSFREDPLRMLRGVRLAARYDYRFEPATVQTLSDARDDLRHMVEHSPQRVFNEFSLWFTRHEKLDAMLELAKITGLLYALGIDTDYPTDTLRHVPENAPDLGHFAAFAYLLPPDTLSALPHRLSMPTDWAETAKHSSTARNVADRCRHTDVADIDLYRSLIGVPDDVIRAVIAVEHSVTVKSRFHDLRNRLRHVRADLNGDDLIALGIRQGPMIGKLLDELFTLRIQGVLSSAEEERRHITDRLTDD